MKFSSCVRPFEEQGAKGDSTCANTCRCSTKFDMVDSNVKSFSSLYFQNEGIREIILAHG